MNLFSRYAFVSLLMTVAGCQDLVSPPSSIVIDGNLVRLTTSASARELETGAPVTLGVRLTNEGTETVTLHFSDGCQILPYIRGARGADVIPNGGWFCTQAITQLTLAPGQSEVRGYVWTGSTELAELRANMTRGPLPPGRYYFTAEVPAGEVTLRSEPIELILK